jgi:hypothetical protein
LPADMDLYTTMQIDVPNYQLQQQQMRTAAGGSRTAAVPGNLCKISAGGVEHFVTIPHGLTEGQSFVRSLPKAYDAVTLRTLDTAELKMWLESRGVRVPQGRKAAAGASAGAEWKSLYESCLQYIMLKQEDRCVEAPPCPGPPCLLHRLHTVCLSAAVLMHDACMCTCRPVSTAEGWEPKWSPTHERYFCETHARTPTHLTQPALIRTCACCIPCIQGYHVHTSCTRVALCPLIVDL